ncbi:MAG: D-2-hydroxyacid dehydrogenase [Planctomycetes bacterium]|nr:D-2-hydroxyacid dehydrogenase [Planctomycetota bacterium]
MEQRKRPRIVVLDASTQNQAGIRWEDFESIGDLEIHEQTPREKVRERLADADVAISNKVPIRADDFAALSKLKYVGVFATGYDPIDVVSARKHGVVVTNVPDFCGEGVAQHTFALLLELTNGVGRHGESVRAGDWEKCPSFCYKLSPIVDLAGMTLGICGYGAIGKRVSRIADAFGMNVLLAKLDYPERKDSANSDYPRASLRELLPVVDVLSLHCRLTPATLRLVRKETIELMKPSAFVINTSRGRAVDEIELADALNSGRIAGFAADVLSIEPPRGGSPLIGAKNCVITPHNSWMSTESMRRLHDIALGNLTSFLAGSPVNVVTLG